MKSSIFKTNMQVFAGIAWVIGIFGIAFSAYHDLSSIDQAASAGKDKDIIVTYLQMVAVTTGVCMGAWGIFFNWRNPSYKVFTFGEEKKKRKKNTYAIHI